MNKKQIRKMQTAAGGSLQLTSEEQKYLEWSKMTPEQKREYRTNRAKSHLQSGPNITNFWEAFQTYIGNRDPENPHLNIGIVNAPGKATPQQVQQSAKLMETINNYWKNLGRLKIRLGGSGKYASGILTKPGTAPTTFNGQNISYITSPKGGNVTHKFYTDQGSEYILTKDGFARRIKSPHSNVEGSDSGLHDWNEGMTIFTKGEDGKLFNTAFYKFSDFGFKPGTYGLVRQNGKAKIMLIDPKTKQWREAMFSDAYPTSVKQGLQQDRVLSVDYSDVPFVGGHILEKASGSWHPGSSVAFIEGLKQGGKMNIIEKFKKGSGIHIKKENRGKFTDYCGGKVTDECIQKGKNSSNPAIRKRATFAANTRKWKHKSGGQIVKEFKIRQKFQQGGSVDWGSIASNILNAGVQTYSANKQIDAQTKLSNADLDKKYSQMIQSLQEVLKHFGQNWIGWQMGNAKDEISKQKRANDDAATSQKTANYVQLFGSVANTALNAFGQYMANRQKNTPTVQQTPVTQQLNTTPQSNIQFNNPSLNDTLYQANNYNFV